MSSDQIEDMEGGVGEEVTITESMVSTPDSKNSSAPVANSGVETVDTAAATDSGEPNPTPPPASNEETPPATSTGSPDQANTFPPPKRLTKIERLMDKMETRRKNRKKVSFSAREKFIDICLAKVKEGGNTGASALNGIAMSDLKVMRDKYKSEGELGEIFDRAVEEGEKADSQIFFFRDFNEYYLTLKPHYFKRNPSMGALVGVLAYYVVSLILFCGIMQNNSTCPRTDGGPSYEGWLTAIYFASVTISTVGYGDVSVIGSGSEVWRTFIGILYMIFAMVVAVTVFSSLSEQTVALTEGAIAPKLSKFFGSFTKDFTTLKQDEALRIQLRKVWVFKILELSLYFLLLNILGMIVAMIIVTNTDEGDASDWSWMTGFYWAVQTTTTIGYGDLSMPFDLRWFNFLFAILGTTFAASLLSSLADLTVKLRDMRTLYVWKNREVSMQLIADMEVDGDTQLDEHEFLIGSLITLGKLDREDVEKIMDKFRHLAGDDQFINEADIEARRKLEISINNIKEYNASKRGKKGDKYWGDVEMIS